MYWGMGNGLAAGDWPKPGGDLVTGGSPRYNIYRTRDGRFLAAAPLEEKFWANFCTLLGVPEPLRDDSRDPGATRAAIAQRVAARSADELVALFAGHDVCATIAVSLRDALGDPHFQARGVFARELAAGVAAVRPERSDSEVEGRTPAAIPALPVPVAEEFRSDTPTATYPQLGEANDLLAPHPET
jgi:crotonobetainyl-CoA:carnitine CoA-transferase CaiB-like acyl-CoA transferase